MRVLLALLVLAACLLVYVHVRQSIVNDEEEAAKAHPESHKAHPASHTQKSHQAVTGHVVFEGARGGLGKAGCDWFDASKFPEANRVRGGNECTVQVDPCKLVGTTLDASPVCHTVQSLCKSGVVPSQKIGGHSQCVLQERGALDHAGTDNLARLQVPEGISVDVRAGGCDGKSVFSKVCTSSRGCAWTPSHHSGAYGMQFGVAPAYRATCGEK